MTKEERHVMTRQEAECVSVGQASHLVVAAVDESVAADSVFDFVGAHYNSPDTHVVFVHVVKPQDILFRSYVVEVSEARGKRYLADGWVNRAHELKMAFSSEGRVLVGDPREELLRFCELLAPPLDELVVGSHGRGLVGRMMLGSVSSFLVHTCPCSVIVVKARRPTADKDGFSSMVARALSRKWQKEEGEKGTASLGEDKTAGEASDLPLSVAAA